MYRRCRFHVLATRILRFLSFQTSQIFCSYVGESEGRNEFFLKYILLFLPCHLRSSAQVLNDLLACKWKQMMVLWIGYKCAIHCPLIVPVWSIWWTFFRHFHHRPWRSITCVSWTLTTPWCLVFFEQLVTKLMCKSSPCHSAWNTNVSYRLYKCNNMAFITNL